MQKPLTTTQQADIITAVPLLKREEYGNHIVYTVLSSDGVTKYYATITRDGKPAGCTCPATVPLCKHIRAALFEEEWIAPIIAQDELDEAAAIAPAILGEMAQDLDAHVEDTLQEVLVFMDPLSKFHDFGTVLISGEPAQYLWIEQIREQYPVHRVITRDEYLEFKQREAEKYRAMFPGDFYDAA